MRWKARMLCWAMAAAVAAAVPAALCIRGQADVSEPESGPKYAALTFDDGPKGEITETLLDGLRERGVRASFFLIGNLAEQYPELVRRMDREGHQIGLHSYDHLAALCGLSQAELERQLGRSRAVLRDILGEERDFMLRPPYGQVDEQLRSQAGCPLILWSVDPEDWYYQDAAREIESVCANVRDGSIILLHDTFPETVEAALSVIDRLHQEGFYFVTAEELLELNGVTPENGVCYFSADQSR